MCLTITPRQEGPQSDAMNGISSGMKRIFSLNAICAGGRSTADSERRLSARGHCCQRKYVGGQTLLEAGQYNQLRLVLDANARAWPIPSSPMAPGLAPGNYDVVMPRPARTAWKRRRPAMRSRVSMASASRPRTRQQ